MTARSPAQFPAQVQVVIQTDDGAERNELVATDAPITIGRHNSCVLHLESDLVSRQHAVVEVGADMIRVEDVSTNGTMVGDMLLRRQAVDVPYLTPIVLGNFTVYFLQPTAVRPRARAGQGAATPGGGGPQVRRPGGASAAPEHHQHDAAKIVRVGGGEDGHVDRKSCSRSCNLPGHEVSDSSRPK